MTYAKLLAERDDGKAIPPLAVKVRQLEKQVASVEDRIHFEIGDVERREGNIARFKDAAAAKLATSTSAYREWQARFKKLTVDLTTARDALALLVDVIAPKTKADLDVARKELLAALTAPCMAVRPAAEARMAELLDAVVAEHDAFLDACVRLHQDHGLVFVPPVRYPGPRVEHARLAHFGKHALTSPMKFLAFTVWPAPAEAPAAVQAVQDANTEKEVQGAVAGEIVQPEPPGEAREAVGGVLAPTKPEREAPPVDVDAQDVPGPEKDAQDAPGATNGERLDSLDPPAEIAEKKATLLTGETS